MTNNEMVFWIQCHHHGRAPGAITCTHLVDEKNSPVGFVDNSPTPTDLQAWCQACETLFVSEGEMTAVFRAFNRPRSVCIHCFELLRQRHSAASG